jgi:hypothetical protein
MFAFFSVCPRYRREIPAGACSCRDSRKTRPALPPGGDLPPSQTLTQAIVSNLGLDHVQPSERPSLGIVSREQKRFLLNELEMTRIALQCGISAKLLPLEYMYVCSDAGVHMPLLWRHAALLLFRVCSTGFPHPLAL